jgi:hypothetical protein
LQDLAIPKSFIIYLLDIPARCGKFRPRADWVKRPSQLGEISRLGAQGAAF